MTELKLTNETYEEYQALADNPDTPVDVLLSLTQWEFYLNVMSNPSYPLEVIVDMLRNGTDHERWLAVRSERLPLDILWELVDDPQWDVRINIVRNAAADEALVRRMTLDTNQHVSELAEIILDSRY